MEQQLLKDVKMNISCLLTSSKDPLSVQELAKDYEMSEGKPIPYRQLGFRSVIELLKSLTDTVQLPENANANSTLTLIACGKSNHLRILVNKQKNQKKKRNSSDKNNNNNTSSVNRRNRSYSNQTNGNNYFLRNDTSSNNQVQYKMCCTGRVTNDLRQHLEKTIHNNNRYLSINQLIKTIKEHQDFPLLKAKNACDVVYLVKSFVEIKGSYCVLKRPVKNGSIHVPHINGYNKDELNISPLNSKSLTNSSSDCRSTLADINIEGVTDLLSKLTTNNNEEHMNSMTLTSQSVKMPINSFERVNDDSFNNLNTSFCHSSAKENKYNITDTKDDKLSMYKNHHIPKEVLLNITKVFNVYSGLNVDNFELLYNILFDTFFDSTTYGFETIINLFKVLSQIIEIKSNVLYKKSGNEFNDCINVKHLNNHNVMAKQENINRIQSEIKLADISLHVEQKLFSSDQNTSKTKMVLADYYNPSLFYVHIYADNIKLTNLMDQMKLFYNENNINYVVKSDHIFAGLTYVSSYTSFSNEKQWLRVKVLGEVDSDIVKVIHVDYGTIDFIPKTELKFLKKQFSSLPCQAIRCCLTSYNELGSIDPEVTHNFLKFINKKPFLVQVDGNFTFDSFCDRYQILHVTLFQQTNGSEVYININNKLSKVLKK